MSADEALARIAARMVDRGVQHRVIGAAALAAHGVTRSTRDLDLLAVDPRVLDPSMWDGVAPPGFTVEVRHGDAADPLVGVVRVEEDLPDDFDWEHVLGSVDVVVLPRALAEPMLSDAGPDLQVGRTRLTAVSARDLILLKLYAGGARDGWDIVSLLEVHPDPAALVEAVEGRMSTLPGRCGRMWRRIRAAP